MTTSIYLISPSFYPDENLVEQRIKDLNIYAEYTIKRPPVRARLNSLFTMDTVENRLVDLLFAVQSHDAHIILAARGGYGASDLLPLIPWKKLANLEPRCLVGFSDISALHSALWTKLGWPGLHGPMLGSPLWGQNSSADISALLALLQNGQPQQGMLRISPVAAPAMLSPQAPEALEGWLFGGCFSVLTNLIGTAYLPSSLAGAILLFEDTGENCGRLLRYWNQWLQSGLLQGVKAVVWGKLSQLEGAVSEAQVKAELAKRTYLPTWTSEDFGHCSPNFPFMIGARAYGAAGSGAGEQLLVWQAP